MTTASKTPPPTSEPPSRPPVQPRRPPNKPNSPPIEPPSKGQLAADDLFAVAETLTAPAGVPSLSSAALSAGQLVATALSLLTGEVDTAVSTNTFEELVVAEETRNSAVDLLGLALAVLGRLQTPARRDPSSAAVGADAIATPGGPGRPPAWTTGECLTPGYGAAAPVAAAGSAGAVLGRSAGASSGRDGKTTFGAVVSRPVEPAPPAGRAGGPPAPGAGFTLPPTPTVPSFDNGPRVAEPEPRALSVDSWPQLEYSRWPGRPFPRLAVPAGEVWQPSTPGQPPTPPPPDPHPQDRVSQALARRAD